MKNKNETNSNYLAISLSIGISLGLVLGTLFDNVGLGICFGVAIGLNVGIALQLRGKKNSNITELISYRQATTDDAKTLKDIAKRVISTNYVTFLGIDATTAFIESGMSDKEIDDGLDNCTVMVYDGQIVGFAITNEAVLHLIMIDPPFQNKGFGSCLMEYIENKLFSEFNCVKLQTFEENTVAVKFYQSRGWAVVGREEVPQLGMMMLHYEKTREAGG